MRLLIPLCLCLICTMIAHTSFAAIEQCGLGDPVASNGIPDKDSDNISNPIDNCLNVANPDQRDTDGDSIGNRCDADLNNDNIVNIEDLGLMRLAFFTNDANADLDGDGIVNIVDLGILRSYFFAAPGPAGPCLQNPASCAGPVDFEFNDIGQPNGGLVVFRTNDPEVIYHARRLISGASECNPSIQSPIYSGSQPYNPQWDFYLDGEMLFHGTSLEPHEICDATATDIQISLDFNDGLWCPGSMAEDNLCRDWCPFSSEFTLEF